MLKAGDKVTVTQGKYSGSKGIVTQVEGEKIWVNLDTPQGKVEDLQLYQSSVEKP